MKSAFLTGCVLFLTLIIKADPGDSCLPVTVKGFDHLQAGNACLFTDSDGVKTFSQIIRTAFTTKPSAFLNRLNKYSNRFHFWVKFNLNNPTDSTLEVFLYCGDFDFINVYYLEGPPVRSPPEPVTVIRGGHLRPSPLMGKINQRIAPTIPLRISAHRRGDVFLEIIQKTEEFGWGDIYLYNQASLYQALGEDESGIHSFIVFQYIFQGILLCQLLYVLFQWIIIRRREYLYYFLYLLTLIGYFLSKYEQLLDIPILFSRFPILTVYLNKTLLILPYFFYFRFVRSFLDMSSEYPVMNKWIIRIENFLLLYVIFDFIFIISTLNARLQREWYTFILLGVFIASASFIFYLFGKRKVLIYYILTGSLFVALGNTIAMVLTYLEDENIVHSIPYILIFSQAGIILEIFCFTAGLSYKSLAAEKEKIHSQEKLIAQLQTNEQLQNKMQNIRNNIAQDLHDEIGSTLSSISILSNLALKEKNESVSQQTMQEIKNSSVTLMEKMDDIVWSINPRNDSLENLLLRIQRFATTLFEAGNIDYSISIQENLREVKLPMDWRQHIYMILKEGINNLIKYAEAKKAAIRVSWKEGFLEIHLEDDGRGFQADAPQEGNGMTGMRNRALLMQSDLKILSEPGKGCRIGLRIKIK